MGHHCRLCGRWCTLVDVPHGHACAGLGGAAVWPRLEMVAPVEQHVPAPDGKVQAGVQSGMGRATQLGVHEGGTASHPKREQADGGPGRDVARGEHCGGAGRLQQCSLPNHGGGVLPDGATNGRQVCGVVAVAQRANVPLHPQVVVNDVNEGVEAGSRVVGHNQFVGG